MLADKGYHNGADIAYCDIKGIRSFIPPSNQHHQKEDGFRKTDFVYHQEEDTYTCPDGKKLIYELTYKKKNNRRNYRVKRYGTKMCEGWPLRSKCTTSSAGGKIERANHQRNAERNNARVARYPDFYRLRQQIVEPIFGIWKRRWHFDHIMLKTKAKVEMKVSLAALTYNLMHLIKIKGEDCFQNALKKAIFSLFKPIFYWDKPQSDSIQNMTLVKLKAVATTCAHTSYKVSYCEDYRYNS